MRILRTLTVLFTFTIMTGVLINMFEHVVSVDRGTIEHPAQLPVLLVGLWIAYWIGWRGRFLDDREPPAS